MDLFTIVPTFIGVIFVVVICAILFGLLRGLGEWAENNGKPVLSENATIIAKRAETSGLSNSHVSTRYYATFELPTTERMEFPVDGSEFGLIVEGDQGILTYQGTRYHWFERGRQLLPTDSPRGSSDQFKRA